MTGSNIVGWWQSKLSDTSVVLQHKHNRILWHLNVISSLIKELKLIKLKSLKVKVNDEGGGEGSDESVMKVILGVWGFWWWTNR